MKTKPKKPLLKGEARDLIFKVLGISAWVLAALLVLAGQIRIFKGEIKPGALWALMGLAVAVIRLVIPQVPWKLIFDAIKAAAKPAPKSLAPAGSSRQGKGAALRAQAGPSRGQALADLVARLFPDDTLQLSRHWLWLPAGSLLLLMQYTLILKGQLTKGSIFLGGAAMFLAVYLQDLGRPIIFTNITRNLKALFMQALALPLQLYGAICLWRYGQVWFGPAKLLGSQGAQAVSSVWFGFFCTVVASLWMLYSLKHFPFNLVEDEEGTSSDLTWTPPKPFYEPQSMAIKASLLAGAAVCAVLSLFVLGPSFAGLRVALGFGSVALLVGSFPWAPFGISGLPRLSPVLKSCLVLGLALFAFYLGMRGQVMMESGRKAASLWMFLFGAIILVASLSRFKPVAHDLEGGEEPAWMKWVEYLLFAALIIAGFQFRIWNINSFPYGAEGDEAGGGVWSMDALKGTVEHPLIHQNYPLHFFSVTAFFFKFFGVTLGTMRWHSVLFGTLSLFSAYFFARMYFGRWAAFLATLLMSFAYWHLHYSRFGHYNIEQVFAQMTAFYFVFKGMRSGRLWHFGVGGMAFALAMFPHMAGRLLPFQGILFLCYLFLMRRDLLRRRMNGLLAFVIASWMIASPAVTYWLRATTVSMGRIQSVSIFDKNNTNAPIDVLAGFVQNTKVSFLMFNDFSDSRHRDNPVAPQKILEHWTAILFALAFLYVAYHWRDPLHFLMLQAFLINLCASIFSVEAPQTLRTAGNIPLVFMFIAALLAHFQAALQGLGRRAGLLLFLAILVPAFSFFSYKSAWKYFVEAKRLAFDSHPTYIAMAAGQRGGPGTQAVFWATGFASSHPPVDLFATKQGTAIRNFYNLAEYLPVADGSDMDHLIFMADDYAQLMPYVAYLYPGVTLETLPDKLGGQDLARFAKVTKDQLQAIQGLEVEGLDAAGRPFKVKNAGLEYPQEGIPAGATLLKFRGSVLFDSHGLYKATHSGKGACDLRLAGKPALGREGYQPKGLVPISVDYRPVPGDRFAVTLNGRPGEYRGFYYMRSNQVMVLGKKRLFSVKPSGFYASYRITRDGTGPEVFAMVEPVLFAHYLDSPLTGNWSVIYKAKLKIEQEGTYSFRMSGPSTEVRVDGQLVTRGGALINPSLNPVQPLGQVRLARGTHRLEALFSTSGPPGMDLFWTRPDGITEVVPSSVLEPEYP